MEDVTGETEQQSSVPPVSRYHTHAQHYIPYTTMLHSTHPSPFFFFFPPRHILGRSLLLCASPILTLLFPPPSFLLLRRKAEGGGDRPKVSFVRSIEMRQPSRESGHPFPSSGNTGVEWKRQSGASGGRGGGGGAESGYTAPKTERRGRATHFPFPRKGICGFPFPNPLAWDRGTFRFLSSGFLFWVYLFLE